MWTTRCFLPPPTPTLLAPLILILLTLFYKQSGCLCGEVVDPLVTVCWMYAGIILQCLWITIHKQVFPAFCCENGLPAKKALIPARAHLVLPWCLLHPRPLAGFGSECLHSLLCKLDPKPLLHRVANAHRILFKVSVRKGDRESVSRQGGLLTSLKTWVQFPDPHGENLFTEVVL